MAKRFKLRISKVIPYFKSCRSKDPSALPIVPVPSFLRLSPVKHKPITLHLPPATPNSPKPHYSSILRHASSAFTSIGCGFRSRSSALHGNRTDSPPPDHFFHWEKQEKWHVVNKLYGEEDEESPRPKIYNSSASGHTSDAVLSLPQLKPKRRTRKKKTKPRIRVSTSSADSGLFSSESFAFADDVDDEELTETLTSSFESLSTDSSPPSKVKNLKRRRFKARKSFGGSSFSPARLSLFQGLIPCVVEGKVKESFAVLKKSEDPREDFKRSMMEMILEKKMFEERDLEQLLHCFLSLNSRDHHGAIIEAFYDIWEVLFCRNSTSGRISNVKISPLK